MSRQRIHEQVDEEFIDAETASKLDAALAESGDNIPLDDLLQRNLL
jgi:hypothetical protein